MPPTCQPFSDEIAEGEVLFEFVTAGPAVKVSALHVPTNTEISLVASAAMSPFTLKANALRKLRTALQRR